MSTIRSFFTKPWLYLLTIILGTALKFHSLNSKLFWEDEVATVLYTTGLKGPEIKSRIPPNQIVPLSFYDSLLHPRTGQYSFNNQVAGILSDTHLTPAHYVFLTLWYRLVGDDNIDYRLFSVFAFLLSLPFMFLLARELFGSALAGWIAASSFAVSPFIHFEAQEARYYSLWVLFFLLSNYLFLKAIRQNKSGWWLGYSVAAILALYTSALSGVLFIGHLVYVLLYKKEHRGKFLVSLFFIFLAYLPWIYFLFSVRETIQSGLAWHQLRSSSFYSLYYLYFQLLGLTKSFTYLLDGRTYNSVLEGSIAPSYYLPFLIDVAVLGLFFYAILFLYRKTPKEKRAFLLLLFVPLFLLFYVSDIIRHTFTSRLWRYQIVNMAAIILVVTNLLQDKISKGRFVFAALYVGLVVTGTLSILEIGANRCWNTRGDCPSNIEEAQYISRASRPLVVTDFSGHGLANFLAVINESKNKSADILYIRGTIPDVKGMVASKGYSDISVLQASDTLAQRLKTQFGEKMIQQKKAPTPMSPQIWHVKF